MFAIEIANANGNQLAIATYDIYSSEGTLC
jgi:hypothetical protein